MMDVDKIYLFLIVLGGIFAFLSGLFLGMDIGNDQVKTITETKIIYINQTDNCLNEVINKFEENQEVIDIITKYIQKIG